MVANDRGKKGTLLIDSTYAEKSQLCIVEKPRYQTLWSSMGFPRLGEWTSLVMCMGVHNMGSVWYIPGWQGIKLSLYVS